MYKSIIASALMLHLALYRPTVFFWLTFFWLVPIFYIVLKNKNKLSFNHGFLWGVVFYSLHLFPITHLVMSSNYFFSSLFFSLLLICYTAFHSGVWFLISQKMSFFKWGIQSSIIISWLLFTCAYLLFLPYGLLWISGSLIGYPFSFPLVPLAAYPQFLWILPLVGRMGLIFFQICFSMTFSLFFMNRKKIHLLFALISLFPFFVGFFIPRQKKNVSDFFEQCGHITLPDKNSFSHPLDAAQEIYVQIRALIKKKPHVKHIFLPELSYRFALNQLQHVVDLWNNNLLKNRIQLFIGAYRKNENKIFNSLYHIKKGKIQKVYDKKLLMPFVEYVPKMFEKLSFFKNIFLQERGQFSPGKKNSFLFDCGNGVRCLPHICADFFLGRSIYKNGFSNKKNDFILLIFNDSIFSFTFFNNLIFLWNRFRAQEQNKSIICIGFNSALLIIPGVKTEKFLTAAFT